MDINRDRAICVSGMHRSGTSAITRSINLLGVEIGDTNTLMKPHIHNPKGYWEQKKITQLNDQILDLIGLAWDSEEFIKGRWWESKRILPYKDELKKMIRKDYGSYKLWLWKDPRTCLLMPLWQEVLNELNIDINYIICIRNPLDIYKSLNSRDGFSLEKSIRIWFVYTLSILYWTINSKRSVVHYEDILNAPLSTIQSIAKALNLPKVDINNASMLNNFIQQKLRHHQSTYENFMNHQRVPKSVKDLYSTIISDRNINSKEYNRYISQLYLSQ
ncbi:sulfotransferase family protein [Evansella sp. AB-rgal1]|uniref:sulfotransferase family protein n=1 Tax=Evansella sp. AB-rgal1 TaxID=3242696 RepID=UPI00359CC34B